MLTRFKRFPLCRSLILSSLGIILSLVLVFTQVSTAIAQILPGFDSEDTQAITTLSVPTFSVGNLFMAPVFLGGLRVGIVTSSASTNFAADLVLKKWTVGLSEKRWLWRAVVMLLKLNRGEEVERRM